MNTLQILMHLFNGSFFFSEKCLATDRSYIIYVYLAFSFLQAVLKARKVIKQWTYWTLQQESRYVVRS